MSAWASVGNVQKQLQGMMDHQVEKENDWAIHIFSEHNREADAWAEKRKERPGGGMEGQGGL